MADSNPDREEHSPLDVSSPERPEQHDFSAPPVRRSARKRGAPADPQPATTESIRSAKRKKELKGKEKIEEVQEVEDEEKGGYVTMRCAPACVHYAAEFLPDDIRARIRELGFGCLLDLNIEKLEDRTFASFLMASVKNDDKGPRLDFGNKSLPITPEAVQLVTGLPRGDNKFSDWDYHQISSGRNTFRKLCDEQGMREIFIATSGKGLAAYNKLSPNEVPRWVVERMVNDHATYHEDWIIRCFLILASNALIFSTTSMNISGADHLIFESLDEAKNYDWCQKMCDDIVVKADRFLKERIRKLKTPSISGCIVFLMVTTHT